MIKLEFYKIGKQFLFLLVILAFLLLVQALLSIPYGIDYGVYKIIVSVGLIIYMSRMGCSAFGVAGRQSRDQNIEVEQYSWMKLLLIKLVPRILTFVFCFLVVSLMYFHEEKIMIIMFFGVPCIVFFILSFSLSISSDNSYIRCIIAFAGIFLFIFLNYFAIAMAFTVKTGIAYISFFKFWKMWDEFKYEGIVPSTMAVFILMLIPFIVSFIISFRKNIARSVGLINTHQLKYFVLFLSLLLPIAILICVVVFKLRASDFPGRDTSYYITHQGKLVEINGYLHYYYIYEERDVHVLEVTGDQEPVIYEDDQDICFINFYYEKLKMDCAHIPDYKLVSHYEYSHNELLGKMANTCKWEYCLHNIHIDKDKIFSLARVTTDEKCGEDAESDYHLIRNDMLVLMSINIKTGKVKKIRYRNFDFSTYYEPYVFAHDKINDHQFWIFTSNQGRVARLWDDGHIDDLGQFPDLVSYVPPFLFYVQNNQIEMSELTETGLVLPRTLPYRIPSNISVYETPPPVRIYCLTHDEVIIINEKKIYSIALIDDTLKEIAPLKGDVIQVLPDQLFYVEHAYKETYIYKIKNAKLELLKHVSEPHLILQLNKNGILIARDFKLIAYTFPDFIEKRFKE